MSNFINENCHGCDLCVRYCPLDAIHGARKQRHTIDAALCIECDACGRVCGFGAVQDSRGELIQRLARELWPIPKFDYAQCNSCNICLQACPSGALGLHPTAHLKSRASQPQPVLLNPKACLGCSLCASACPPGAIHMFSLEIIAG